MIVWDPQDWYDAMVGEEAMSGNGSITTLPMTEEELEQANKQRRPMGFIWDEIIS